MNINIREDSVEIEGYVNAVERNSKPLMSRIGHFIERICKGAFGKAIKRNDDIHILLNHDWDRDLGSTKQGNLELEEDNIGLHARATITDPEVIKEARQGDLVGWSFGFTDRDVQNTVEHDMPVREVKDLNLFEVSILDRTKTPAYDGTLIYARSTDEGEQMIYRGAENLDEPKVEEPKAEEPKEEPQVVVMPPKEDPKAEPAESVDKSVENEQTTGDKAVENPVDNIVENKKIDYTKYESMIAEMKALR